MRPSNRQNNEIRKIKFTKDYIKHPEGSVLVEFGNTKVICNATLEEKTPRFLKGTGSGWVTAEYGMLPRSTNERMMRESKNRQSGRTMEIQRLIGRSLRASVFLEKMTDITVTIDCDVIQADGGTRTASITGGFVALKDALIKHYGEKDMESIIKSNVASVSVGKYQSNIILDLDYEEDSNAEADVNFVMNAQHELVEVQGTAEKNFFSREEFNQMLNLAEEGVVTLIEEQNKLF